MPQQGEVITSRRNPLLRRVREARDEHEREFVLEGRKFVSDAIAAGWTPTLLVLAEDFPFEWYELRPLLVSSEVFDSLSDTRAAQGALALFKRRDESLATLIDVAKEKLVVVLDEVQDPGNVGTILRLAAAFDAGGVILLEGCADAFGPKAVRASTGAILHVPTARGTRKEFLALSQKTDVQRFAATADGNSSFCPIAGLLILGSEGRGVDQQLREASGAVAIRTSGRVESLNVAMACAVFLSRAYDAAARN